MHRVIAEVLTLDMSTIIWTLIFHKKKSENCNFTNGKARNIEPV